MKNLYTVVYRKDVNFNRRPVSQSANRRAGFRSFETLAAAREFAATVEAVKIFDNTGKTVAAYAIK